MHVNMKMTSNKKKNKICTIGARPHVFMYPIIMEFVE
jgi:hypothetical protein